MLFMRANLFSKDPVEPRAQMESELVQLSAGGTRIIILAVFLIFLAGLWTVMRIRCRRMRNIPLQLEDWLHLIALAFFHGQHSGTFVSLAVGAGHHTKNLTKSQFSRFL
ncbi:hypothetical protein F4779DRAFT_623682 [Xylariaceae sp. FL0662B]|nr:hypothetical protein F4779DRAFT_623682 [Xylariaceae sp. FL0662B]